MKVHRGFEVALTLPPRLSLRQMIDFEKATAFWLDRITQQSNRPNLTGFEMLEVVGLTLFQCGWVKKLLNTAEMLADNTKLPVVDDYPAPPLEGQAGEATEADFDQYQTWVIDNVFTDAGLVQWLSDQALPILTLAREVPLG